MNINIREAESTLFHTPTYIMQQMFIQFPPFFLTDIDESIDGALSDKCLLDLAKNIETEEHVYSLATTLGFSRAEIERCLVTNRITGKNTYKGTLDMLSNWRMKTKICDQLAALRKALRDSGLTMIAETYLPGRHIKGGNYCTVFSINVEMNLSALKEQRWITTLRIRP